MSWREGLLSLGTTLGVLALGGLPGIMLAVALSLAWLLMVASRSKDAVLGRVPGLPGFHNVAGYPKRWPYPPSRPDLGRVLGDRCKTWRSWRQGMYFGSLNHSLRECESGQPNGHVHDSRPSLRAKAEPTFLEHLQHCSVVW
jgi:hypothetical protein